MAIDEQDFLREATVRICSNLDIETALGRFLRYVEKFKCGEGRACLDLAERLKEEWDEYGPIVLIPRLFSEPITAAVVVGIRKPTAQSKCHRKQ
jgi:hypothetical protein